jgi:hypothetical protein
MKKLLLKEVIRMIWVIGILGLAIGWGVTYAYYRSDKVRAQIATDLLKAKSDVTVGEADVKAAYEKVIADIKKVI